MTEAQPVVEKPAGVKNVLNHQAEPSGWIAQLPTLGAGVGFREPFKSELFLNRTAVDFLEITADHFFDPTPGKAADLDLLADHFTLIPHGLNLSLGSSEPLDERYVEQFASLVAKLDPPWWSEHIAFTRAGGVEIGHLTPLPFTDEALENLCRNVAAARQIIGPRLILENITFDIYLPEAEMNEAEFLVKLLRMTDCGMLLDVTNLHTNAVNHGYDPLRFLDLLPAERMVQLHCAGGHQSAGKLVDSHSQPTPLEIWDLLDEVVRRAPVRGVIIERDDNLPPFQQLAGEVDQARLSLTRHSRGHAIPPSGRKLGRRSAFNPQPEAP